MGVKVTFGYCNGERIFSHARDWFVTDERVLQIYQEHEGDPEFVVMEYNRDAWEGVEWDPPVPAPQPEDADRPAVDPGYDDVTVDDPELMPGKWYREHTAAQLRAEYNRRGLLVPLGQEEDPVVLARGLIEDDKKAEEK